MNEYVIHAKVKNNLLLSRILDRAENVNKFCAEENLCPSAVGELINMKTPALKARGWILLAQRLSDIFECDPEDLFTEEQRVAKLRSNSAFVEMSRQQVMEIADPLKMLEASDLVEKILSHPTLRHKEKKVLRLRYVNDMTLTEVAESFDVSIERVRQIEAKALRRLRDPHVSVARLLLP